MENNKKNLWAFYTPNHVVEELISKMNSFLPFSENSKVLEPSGWDGVFIKSLLQTTPVKKDNILILDINKETQKEIEDMGIRFIHCDTLPNKTITWKFTHILWNPPYLNKQSSYIKENKTFLKDEYKEIGVNDTYAMFVYKCSQYLEEWGVLWFVLSDTFFTLWIHKKFRSWLLKNYTIKEIRTLPKSTFKEASVQTCLLIIENKKPTETSTVKISLDEDNSYFVAQKNFYNNPNYIFNIWSVDKEKEKLLECLKTQDKLVNYLDGWLWMHTKDNNTYAFNVEYPNWVFYAKKKVKNSLSFDVIKQQPEQYAFFHKQGWNYSYYSPVEYAVKVDAVSKSNYSYPSYFEELYLSNRKWFIVSWVCWFLNARCMFDKAYWESNKTFWFFSKDEKQYPIEYFLWLLNSDKYIKMVKILNHTNSIQIRDIKELPMIHLNDKDKEEMITLVKEIISKKKVDLNSNIEIEQDKINKIIKKYFD